MLSAFGYLIVVLMVWGAIAGIAAVIVPIAMVAGAVLITVFVVGLLFYGLKEWWSSR